MQATLIPKRARFLTSAAALSLLLNTGWAQATNPAPGPDTTTTTTTTTTATPVANTGTDEATPYVLSPFEVSSTQDTGYRARNTLAGSRINTDLKDVASPITVVTKDFLNDIGASDVNDILTYEVGTEGTKDFSSNTPQLGRTSDNAAQDPNGSTRGRGLAPFDITRDYFYSIADVTTGVPHASASSRTRPKPSTRDGNTKACAARNSATISSSRRTPVTVMSSPKRRPSSATRASNARRYAE